MSTTFNKKYRLLLLALLFLGAVPILFYRWKDHEFIPNSLRAKSSLVYQKLMEGLFWKGNSKKSGVVDDGKYGYLLVTQYSDQMTGASTNILSLQCWASTISHHVRVVEPFLRSGSNFGYDLTDGGNMSTNTSSEVNLVRLRDVFDMASWERETSKRGFSPLVSWEDFLIVVATKLAPRHQGPWHVFRTSVESFAKRHGFRLARYVSYNSKKVYSKKEFRTMVYGNFTPRHVTVVFCGWGGIVSTANKQYRHAIPQLRKCNRRSFSSFPYRNSLKIALDGQRYQEKYMPQSKDTGYISVMLRIQRYALFHDFRDMKSHEKKWNLLTRCINSISKHVDILKKTHGLNSIFLSMDSGKHGSNVFRDNSSAYSLLSRELVDKVAATLHQRLYGNSSSLLLWEESFDNIASFKTPGYIAQLQKYLAYSGVCLLTAGGGSFQSTAMKLHKEKHISSNVNCAYWVPNC